jgi:NADH:ubiquinone oxidoreductase subunit 3 (subunit A)
MVNQNLLSGYALCSSRRVINAEIKSHDHEGHEEHEGENNRKHPITYCLYAVFFVLFVFFVVKN